MRYQLSFHNIEAIYGYEEHHTEELEADRTRPFVEKAESMIEKIFPVLEVVSML